MLNTMKECYIVELDYGNLVLGLRQFWLLPQVPQKMMRDSKEVKIYSKIIIVSLY